MSTAKSMKIMRSQSFKLHHYLQCDDTLPNLLAILSAFAIFHKINYKKVYHKSGDSLIKVFFGKSLWITAHIFYGALFYTR